VGEIYRFRADVAVLSPVGLDAKHGASSFQPHEAAIARAMTRQAGRLILLADHTKLGLNSRMNYASIEQVSALVTDSSAAILPAFAALQQVLPRVVLA